MDVLIVSKTVLLKKSNAINARIVDIDIQLDIGANPEVKRQALELYLEWLGFRSIGRFLKYSHVGIFNWIKSYGSEIQKLSSNAGVEVMKLDEPYRRWFKKNYC